MWTRHSWTWVCGNTVSMASGNPVRPSTQAIKQYAHPTIAQLGTDREPEFRAFTLRASTCPTALCDLPWSRQVPRTRPCSSCADALSPLHLEAADVPHRATR